MFFKLRLAVFMASLAGTGCSFHLHEAPPGETLLKLSASETGCLSTVGPTFSAYIKGRATDEQVSALWDCASKSLALFAERTRGATPGVYTPNELREFLERYFIAHSVKISDRLLAEAMELKRTIVGGTTTEVTVDQLNETQYLIKVLKEQTLRLRPFMPILASPDQAENSGELDQAIATIESVSGEIGSALQKNGYPYFLYHLENLLNGIKPFFPELHFADPPEQLSASIRLMENLKSILMGTQPDQIGGGEWGRVLILSARWFGVSLRIGELLRSRQDLSLFPGRERVVFIAKEVDELLQEAIVHHPNHLISFNELDNLIEALPSGSLRPLTAETAKSLFPSVVRKLLSGNDFGPTGREADGITEQDLSRAKYMADLWAEGQRYLELLFLRLSIDFGTSNSFTARQIQYPSLKDIFGQPEDQIPIKTLEAVNWIRQIVNATPAYFKGPDQIFYFGLEGVQDKTYTLSDLSWMNAYFVAADLLVQGYIQDNSRKTFLGNGVLFPEFQQFYFDIKPVLYDTRLYDGCDPGVAKRRFREGNLFAFVADGNDELSVAEAGQLLAMLVSAELVAHRMTAIVSETCTPSAPDWFDRRNFEANCYRKAFFKNFERVWSTMPGLIQYYRSLSPGDRAGFEKNYEIVSRETTHLSDPVTPSDTESFAGMGQYIETLFERFDSSSHTGVLSKSDLHSAFSVFKHMLRQIPVVQKNSIFESDDNLEALFMYLIVYGAEPDSGIWGGIAFETWIQTWNSDFIHGIAEKFGAEPISADRGKVMRVFAMLAAQAESRGVCDRMGHVLNTKH